MPEIPFDGSEVRLTYNPISDFGSVNISAVVGKFWKSYCVLVMASEFVDGKTNYFLSPYAEFPDADSAYELARDINRGYVEAFRGECD